MKNIITNLWFDSQAEEAAKFYVSIFPNSRVGAISRYNEAVSRAAGRPVGSVMTVEFNLNGRDFLGLNGGPMFKFSEAVSFIVECETQQEIDRYWSALTANGGQESMCGWLKDRFGLSWQIVPIALGEMMKSSNAGGIERMSAALMQMKKLNVAELTRAFAG